MENQRSVIQPVTSSKPKVAKKPSVASKPTHLKKTNSIDKQEQDNAKPLAKRSSLQHMTPKIWVPRPLVETVEPERKPSAKQRKVPPSPFGCQEWRPAPVIHAKTSTTSSRNITTSSVPEETNKSTTKPEAAGRKLQTIKSNEEISTHDEKDKPINGSSPDLEENKNENKPKLSLANPKRIPHRPSCRRDPKSPGFGTLIKMWDVKQQTIQDTSKTQSRIIPVSKPISPTRSDTWKPVLAPSSVNSNSSNDSNSIASNNEYRQRASSVKYQSPTPFVLRSSLKNSDKIIGGNENQNKTHELFNFDQIVINKLSKDQTDDNSSCSNSKEPSRQISRTNSVEAEKPDAATSNTNVLTNAEVAVYQFEQDDDCDVMNVGTYQEFEDKDDNIQSAVYDLAQDVTDDQHLQGYLPMSGNLSSTVLVRYERMNSEPEIPEVDYSHLVVPPPQIGISSKPEYHEIDPDVPPPPDREPPKLPPGLKSSPLHSVLDDPYQDPPPLPPDNVVGRRSMILSKHRQRIVVQDLNSKVNQGEKKLNYVEVDTTMTPTTKPSSHRKTNYTEVAVYNDGDYSTRDRSGSGTSEEGLSANPAKNKSKVKKKIQALFASKDQPSPDKQAEKQEQLTDFEKERNKKKRISGRFMRKKKPENDKIKKDRNSAESVTKSLESDSGTGDLESASPATSRSISIVTSSGGSSNQSSGDGEVVMSQSQTDDSNQKWKVLPDPPPSSSQSPGRRWSQDNPRPPIARPRTINKSLSQTSILSESVYNDGSDMNNPPGASKVSSFLHGGAPNNFPSNETDPLPPKPLPRESSIPNAPPQIFPKPTRGVQQSPPHSPRSPTQGVQRWDSFPAKPPPLPPSVEVEDGESPPPLPERDPIQPDYEYIPEASNIVPPSPFGVKPSFKLIDSEPLYQIYRTRTLSHASSRRHGLPPPEDKEWKSEIGDLGTSTLWRTIPEVESSGLLASMSKNEIKLQQAQFEVITSEASYIRSLNILVSHFMEDWAMESSDILPTKDRHVLFSNIPSVRSVEQRFLQDLETHFWENKKLSKVCDLLAEYAKSDFDVYVRYIQNQVYQDRLLTKLQRTQERFAEELCRIESSPNCNKLPLLSFLLLPMQRVTRLPLLVTAIVNAADSAGDNLTLKKAKHALGVVNKLVKKCNEGARKMQQTEQLAEIASQLDYATSVKMFALVSQSRSLVKKGEMSVSMTSDSKKGNRGGKLWIFLFTDVLLVARKKSFIESGSSPRYEVLDWAKRNMLYVNEKAVSENSIFLVLLENHNNKRIEMTLSPSSQNELSRWTEALCPPNLSSTGESIYETWDCPQYTCINPYSAQQPDELSIDVNDVMQVLKKTSDGWLEGERMRDGETGWFPAAYCDEIQDEHVRARNLKNLYKTIVL